MAKLQSIVQWWRGGAQKRVVILLYHQIADFRPDPQLLCVTQGHFNEHLQIIRQSFTSISLRDLKSSIQSRDFPDRGVVVTFDDGYFNNLQNAHPLLESYQIPATIFVTSGYVGRQDEMVSDTLEHILLQTESLPSTLQLRLNGGTHEWVLGNYPAQHSAWDVTMGGYPTPRHRCYYDLHRLLRTMNAIQRCEVVQQLMEWAGKFYNKSTERRIMDVHELHQISRSGLVEIGSHTVNHLMLTKHPINVQRSEIADSKQQLEQMLGKSVTSFAYPYGGKSAVDHRTIECVQRAGFELACDNVPRYVVKNTNLFALPRFLVRDWNGREFHSRLENMFS